MAAIDGSAYYAIRRVLLYFDDWVPIKLPYDCTCIVIDGEDNPNTIRIRTDKDDPNTQSNLPPGTAKVITTNPRASHITFQQNVTIFWLQSSAGSGPAVLEFAR